MPTTLYRNHFQIAYVVREIDAAMRLFRDRYGVARWHVMDMGALNPGSPTRYIATAYSGEVMLELIDSLQDAPSIYGNWLADGQAVRLHHLGFWAHSPEELAAARSRFEANGQAIAAEGRFGDILDFLYADCVAELGHYYEIVHLLPAGRDFFAATPRND